MGGGERDGAKGERGWERSSPRLHRDLDAMSTRCIERDRTARERELSVHGPRRDAMQIRAS